MFYSDSQDLILSNICYIINPTEKYRNTVFLWYGGIAKTKKINRKCSRAYSWFIHILSSKFYLVDILKTQQNQVKFYFYSNKYVIVPHIVKTLINKALFQFIILFFNFLNFKKSNPKLKNPIKFNTFHDIVFQ